MRGSDFQVSGRKVYRFSMNQIIINKKEPIMKYLLIYSAFLLIQCNNSGTPLNPAPGHEFEINYGQSRTLDNYPLTIKFKNVIEDSRCPENAVCVWEGNARIAIEVSQKDFILNTVLEPEEIDYLGFKIRLIEVYPYPKINEQIEIEDYTIKLVVDK